MQKIAFFIGDDENFVGYKNISIQNQIGLKKFYLFDNERYLLLNGDKFIQSGINTFIKKVQVSEKGVMFFYRYANGEETKELMDWNGNFVGEELFWWE